MSEQLRAPGSDHGHQGGPFTLSADTIRRGQTGDALALHEILSVISPYVGRICGSVALDDGPDAAQETLVIVFRELRRLRDPDALAGWVRTIATREAIRVARRRSSARTTSLEHTRALPAQNWNAYTSIEIRSVLATLTPEHRAVLLLHAYEGLPESEIAELVGIPPGTVKSRLSRARSNFRKEWNS